MQQKLTIQTGIQSAMECPICEEEIFSGLGKGCMMCGMTLENNKEKFCCGDCKIKYSEINNI